MAPLGQLLKTPLYYADLGWDILIVAGSWEANRRLIIFLDSRYSWISQKLERLVIQFFTALPMTFVIIIPMIYLWNEVLTDHGMFDTANLLVMDIPLIVVFTLMVHMVYTGMYFYQYFQSTIRQLESRINELELSISGKKEKEDLMDLSHHRKIMVLNYGTLSMPVETTDIAYIYKQDEISYIKTYEGKTYTSTSPLDYLENELDPSRFYRVNRQMIANIKSIHQFRTDASGKLLLSLLPDFKNEVTISKKKASSFKNWLGKKI
jgi:hypothetical protein